MASLKLIFVIMTTLTFVNSGICADKKDSIICELSTKTRLVWPEKGTHVFDADTVNRSPIDSVQVLTCNLFNNSGFYYNNIGEILLDIYDVEVKENQTVMSDDFKNEKSSVQVYELSFVDAEWQLLPNGFNSFVHNLTSFNVTHSGLSILDKKNFMQFNNSLKSVNFSCNLLTYITEDVFEFSTNLVFADFSNNFIKHMPCSFISSKVASNNQIAILTYYGEVDCDDGTFKDCTFGNKAAVSAVLCENPDYKINYNNLENIMTKQYEEKEISCKVACGVTETKLVYTCNMTVDHPKTFAIKNRDFKFIQADQKCDELEDNGKSGLVFTHIQLKYIPKRLKNAIGTHLKFDSLEICYCLLKSLNEFDMMQFGNDLLLAVFSNNELVTIGRNTFRHNRNLVTVVLRNNFILYIDAGFSKFHINDNLHINEIESICYGTE